MSTDARAALLAETAPFSELPEAALNAIASALESLQLDEDQVLGPFDPPASDGIYLIESGEVALVHSAGEILEKRRAGELIGHAITIDGERPIYRARALVETRLVHLPSQALNELTRTHPVVGQFLEATPGDRLRSIDSQRSERLAHLQLRRPITVTPDTTIRQAAEAMARHRVSSLPIVEADTLIGMVTDRDLRSRVVAAGVETSQPISAVMTPSPVTARLEGRIDDALVEMMKLGVHHLPVLDEQQRLRAVVSAGDLMRIQSPHPLRLVRDIQRAEDGEEVASLARQSPAMLADLVHRGSEVTEVGRMASMVTDACTKRLIERALETLGEAPMAWCWTAFGSQARMEQGLISDQDNGLILERRPEGDETDYFKTFADQVCDGLNACGYIYCPGGVMAKGDWRMAWKDWRRTFNAWMVEPEPKAVMQSSIFFDMRPVAGDLELAHTLHAEVLKQASESTLFRRFLAAESMGNRPALGLFGQFAREDGDGDIRGINLKKRGVIPIVDLARVRALEGAIGVVHTEERIRAAAEAEVMNASDADDLIHALRFIGNVRLRHQVALFDAGEKPNHLVDPDELSGLHRRYLRSAFGIVKTAQRALEQRYTV
jgi:CBS domain-containing protein